RPPHLFYKAIFDPFIRHFLDCGAIVHGYTATPTNLYEGFTELLVAATKAELRQMGVLVPCDVFAPSDPDIRGVRMDCLGEFIQAGAANRIMQCTVFGDFFESWERLNPCGLATLVWAPGVPESRWLVEQFRRRGVRAEHIDADTPEDERT